jgi:hypothetical protein
MQWLDEHFQTGMQCTDCPSSRPFPCAPCEDPDEPKPKPKPLNRFNDCNDVQVQSIQAAITKASSNLDIAIAKLFAKPLTDDVKNALWLAFRDDSLPTATQAETWLTNARNGLTSATFECEEPDSFLYNVVCGESGHGYGSPIPGTGNIHLCMGSWDANSDAELKTHVIIHEAIHRFNPNLESQSNESYFDPICLESADTMGRTFPHRQNNVDSHACVAHFLTHQSATELSRLASQYRGEQLILRQYLKAGEEINLSSPNVKNPKFRFDNTPRASGFKYRWVIFAEDGQRYLMTSPLGKVIDPSSFSEVDAAIINLKTRALLKQRGIKNAEVHCTVLIPTVGQKSFNLPIKFRL